MLDIKWYDSCVDTILDRYICGGSALKSSRNVTHGDFFIGMVRNSSETPILVNQLVQQTKLFKTIVQLFTQQKITRDLLLDAHSKLYTQGKSITTTFRQIQNQIRVSSKEKAVFTPPDFSLVPDLMNVWLHDLQLSENPSLSEIIVLYNRFLAIHPFNDGNGRVARALMKALMRKNGYFHPPLEIYRFNFDEEEYSRLNINVDINNVHENKYWGAALSWSSEVTKKIESAFEACRKKIESKTFLYSLNPTEKTLIQFLFKHPVITKSLLDSMFKSHTLDTSELTDRFHQMGLVTPQIDPSSGRKVVLVCEDIFNLLFDIDDILFAPVKTTFVT